MDGLVSSQCHLGRSMVSSWGTVCRAAADPTVFCWPAAWYAARRGICVSGHRTPVLSRPKGSLTTVAGAGCGAWAVRKPHRGQMCSRGALWPTVPTTGRQHGGRVAAMADCRRRIEGAWGAWGRGSVLGGPMQRLWEPWEAQKVVFWGRILHLFGAFWGCWGRQTGGRRQMGGQGAAPATRGRGGEGKGVLEQRIAV